MELKTKLALPVMFLGSLFATNVFAQTGVMHFQGAIDPNTCVISNLTGDGLDQSLAFGDFPINELVNDVGGDDLVAPKNFGIKVTGCPPAYKNVSLKIDFDRQKTGNTALKAQGTSGGVGFALTKDDKPINSGALDISPGDLLPATLTGGKADITAWAHLMRGSIFGAVKVGDVKSTATLSVIYQ